MMRSEQSENISLKTCEEKEHRVLEWWANNPTHSPFDSPKRSHEPPLGIPQSKKQLSFCGNSTEMVQKLSNSALIAADFPEQWTRNLLW